MNQRRRLSRKQKRARHRNKQQALKAARHLTPGDQHDEDRKAAEAIRQYPNVPRLKQPPFPREREFGFVGHYINDGFVSQEAEAFEAMNVAWKKDAWYWRHDKRGNREPRREDTGIVETNASLSSGLAQVVAKLVEGGELKVAQELAQAAGEAGMAELKNRTGYEPAYLALHPDARGTLSFHFGLWPVDREQRCLIGRSAGGKPGRRGLRTLGHAFICVLRHHDAIGLPEDLVRRAKKNLEERDSDDWAVAVAMDRKLRDELRKLPNGKELLAQADEFQKAAARDWLERFYATGEGVAMLKAERDKALEKLRRRKVAAERLARMRTRRLEEQKLKLEVQAKNDRQAAYAMSNKVAEQTNAIKTALCHMGVDSEKAGSESCAVLVQKSEQVMKALNQAGQDLHAAQSELNERKTRLDAANERITGLESELKKLKKLAGNLVDELRAKSVKLRTKAADLLSRLSEHLRKRADMEHGPGFTSVDDSMP
jgi:hypothetical protein